MRKIALFINHDYFMGGTTRWAIEIIRGFDQIGVPITVIQHKNQKRNLCEGRTSNITSVIVRNADQAVKVLDDHDVFILQSNLDGTNVAKKTTPWWAEVVKRTKTPWITATHDDAYFNSIDPVSPELYTLPTFQKRVIAQAVLPVAHVARSDYEQFPMVLPYTTRPYFEPAHRSVDVTFAGQLMKIKNWFVLARIARRWADLGLPAADFQIRGRTGTSPGVCATHRLYDLMLEQGAFAVVKPHENVHHPSPWQIEMDSSTLSYGGSFEADEVYPILSNTVVALNTTLRRGGSIGPCEYITLEAADAGAVPVQSLENAMASKHLETHAFKFPDNMKYLQMPKTIRGDNDAIVRDVANAVYAAWQQGTEDLPKLQSYNKAALIREHSPDVIARKVLELL